MPTEWFQGDNKVTPTQTLITKVANAVQGHDSLGPTGLVVHLTPAERDKIVASLADDPALKAFIQDTPQSEPNDGWSSPPPAPRAMTREEETLVNQALIAGTELVAPLGRADDGWKYFNYENILSEAKARLVEARSHPTKWRADNRENMIEYWCAWAAHANAVSVCPAPPAQSGAGEIDNLLAMLRDWKDYCSRQHDRQGEAQAFEDALRRITTLTQALAEAETLMEPFDVIAATKGGTPQAEKLRAIICAILKQTPNSDLGAVNEFCRAVLAARAWLERRKSSRVGE